MHWKIEKNGDAGACVAVAGSNSNSGAADAGLFFSATGGPEVSTAESSIVSRSAMVSAGAAKGTYSRGTLRPRTNRSICDAVLSGAASLRNRAHDNAMNFGNRSRIRRSSRALSPGRYGLESCRCTMISTHGSSSNAGSSKEVSASASMEQRRS